MVRLFPTARSVKIPGGVSACRLVSRNGRRILVVSRTGGVWLLEVTPEKREAKVIRTPLVIHPEQNPELHASHDLSCLLIAPRDTMPRVVTVPSGRVIYPRSSDAEAWPAPPEWQCRARSLTPDGRYVIELNDRQSRLRDLDGFGELGPVFDAWHWCETDAWMAAGKALVHPGTGLQPLYLDHVDDPLACSSPFVAGVRAPFYLVAPCYGFVVSHVAGVVQTPAGPVGIRVAGRTRTCPAPVYDPSTLVRPGGFRHVIILDQFRSGLTALNPKTGVAQEFPRCEPHWYGDIYAFVPCGTAPMAWVDTKHGVFLWHMDGRKQAREPLPNSPSDVVAFYPDALLSADRDRLFWMDLRVSTVETNPLS